VFDFAVEFEFIDVVDSTCFVVHAATDRGIYLLGLAIIFQSYAGQVSY
jgi:hypothetical protein